VKYYINSFRFLLFIILALIFVGCANSAYTVNQKQEIKVLDNLPTWFDKNYKSKTKIYGKAYAKSTSKAVDHALVDAISKIAIDIKSEKYSYKTDQKQVFISKTIQEVKKTFISEYTIEKLQSIDSHKVLLLSLNKNDLIDTVNLTIQSYQNELLDFSKQKLEKLNILERIKILNIMIELSNKIEYLNSMLSSLGYSKNLVQVSNNYQEQLAIQMQNIKINFITAVNPEIYPDLKNKLTSTLLASLNIVDDPNKKIKFIEKRPYKLIKGKKDTISSATAITSDGKYGLYANYYNNNHIHVWDLKKSKIIRTLKGHKNSVYSLVISKNNKYALSEGSDKTIKYWDFKKGKLLKTIKVKNHRSYPKFSSNGKYVLFYDGRNTIKYMNLRTGKTIYSHKLKKFGLRSLSLSKDNKYIVAGDFIGNIAYINLKTGKMLNKVNIGSNNVNVAISNDKKYVLAATEEGNYAYWNLKSGKAYKAKLETFKTDKIAISKSGNYGYFFHPGAIRIVNLKGIRDNKKTPDIMIKGNFRNLSFSNNRVISEGKSYENLSLFKIYDKSIKSAIENKQNQKIVQNTITFDLKSCAEAYTALGEYGVFGGLYKQVKIYQGCNKLTVLDANNVEIYSKRIEGMKIRDEKNMLKASTQSYHSKKSQDHLKDMLKDISEHDTLQYITRGSK
jgi:WD40 repeat protein